MKSILWTDDAYKRIRENFMNRCQADYHVSYAFDQELKQFGGAIVHLSYDSDKLVHDSLGMNSVRRIEFASEDQCFMFLLKWS